MFEPLKITAYLQCGIITDPFLPIDGVLYYQVMREQLGEQVVTLPGQSSGGPIDHRLPLKQINSHSRQWFYAASFAVWPEHTVEGTDYWNKRLDMSLIDLVDWQGKKARFEVASGRYKSYHLPVFYRSALSVSWYVVGEKAEIEWLLRTVTNLGKKTAQGWGAVNEWQLELAAEDWSVWSNTGRLMRAIPQENGALYGLRPSYWNPRHQFPCRLPSPGLVSPASSG